MFKQLSPLLSTRSLVITAALLEPDRIRVTITPRAAGKDDPKELSQPFAVEGTAEELDNELPAAIAAYTTEHMTLARSLEVIKTNMEAALKSAKAEADKKIAEAKKSSKPISSPKPAEATTPPEPPKPAMASLFDAQAAASAPEVTLPRTADEASPATTSTPASQPKPTLVNADADDDAVVDSDTDNDNDNDNNEEDEILKEAFYGAQNDLIAA